MPRCEKCGRDKETVKGRKFLCHEVTIYYCFECANIPTCPCNSKKKASVEDTELTAECTYCKVPQRTKMYDFHCGKCRKRLCKNCANEPKCPAAGCFECLPKKAKR